MNEWITAVLIVTGVGWILTAAIGVVRLPDVLCRAHAMAKALTLGIALLLLGMWVSLGEEVAGLKVFLAIFFQIITIPVASHLINLLAFQKNIPRWRQRPMDDHRKLGSGTD